MSGVRSQCSRQNNHRTGANKIVEFNEGRTVLRNKRRLRKRIGDQEFDSEWLYQLGDGASDATEANDANLAAAQCLTFAGLIIGSHYAVAHFRRVFRDATDES